MTGLASGAPRGRSSGIPSLVNGERRVEVVELVKIATAMGSDPRDVVQIVRDAEEH